MLVVEANHALLHDKLMPILWSINPVHWSSPVCKLVTNDLLTTKYHRNFLPIATQTLVEPIDNYNRSIAT